MTDDREDVTFLSCKGFGHGVTVFCQLDKPPLETMGPMEWGSYYRFRMIRKPSGAIAIMPVAITAPQDWRIVGRLETNKIPKFYGHAVSSMFREYVMTNARLSRIAHVADADDEYPDTFFWISDVAFSKKGVGSSPFDQTYQPRPI